MTSTQPHPDAPLEELLGALDEAIDLQQEVLAHLSATAEAVALHYLDNLDAKLNAFETALLADIDEADDWTGWSRVFNRRLFKGRP